MQVSSLSSSAPSPSSSSAPTPIELRDLSSSRPNPISSPTLLPASEEEGVSTALPPVDKGARAWLFLASAAMLEALVWGIPFSSGVLHQFWIDGRFKEESDKITLAVSLQTGLLYMLVVAYGPILTRFPYMRMKLQFVGLAALFVGILGCGFATSSSEIILFLGIIYPFSALLYMPAIVYLFEWFQERRGIATGIMYSGTGAGGTIYPFLMNGLLTRFSYKTAFIAMAVGTTLLSALCLIYLQPRIILKRNSPSANARRKLNLSFMKTGAFYSFTGAILVSSLGNFIPSIWVPTYAAALLPNVNGALFVAFIYASSVPGLLLLGYLADRLPLRSVIALSMFGSSFAILFIWGFGASLASLIIFSIIYGGLGIAFSALWSSCITVVARDDPTVPTLMSSAFFFCRGIGNITSGPVSTYLLKINSMKGSVGGYGVQDYGPLLLYAGLTSVAGACIGVSYREPKARPET